MSAEEEIAAFEALIKGDQFTKKTDAPKRTAEVVEFQKSRKAQNSDAGGDTINDSGKIAELAVLTPVEYDKRRTDAAKEMGIRATTLDKVVAKARPAAETEEDFLIFPKREMHSDTVERLDEVLDGAAHLILSFMAMDKHWGDVTALWCLHTYAVDCFPASPRYAAESPTHECGKSTLLNIIKELVHRPLKTSNIQPAGIFRIAEQYAPTLLIDEGDSFLNDNEPLRGILNSGHAQGDVVIRVEGDPLTPRPYRVYGACAFGLIGELPPTLQSRSIVNKLKRATGAEVAKLRTFRTDRPPAEFGSVASQFWRWAEDNKAALKVADPDMGGLVNRAADNWRPLFAIADIVGGEWPARVRTAAAKVCEKPDALPINLQLLVDVRGIVLDGSGRARLDTIPSTDLLAALVALDSRPWADWSRGKPMTTKALARQLAPFEITPTSDGERRGYSVAAMCDAFARYIPVQCVNVSESQQTSAFSALSHVSETAATDTLKNARNAHSIRVSDTLTHRNPENAEQRVCAQCGGGGDVLICAVDGETVALHRQCFDAFMARAK